MATRSTIGRVGGDGDLGCVEVKGSLQRLSTPGAVDVTQVVHLGGVPQAVSIRGKHRRNTVLVFVDGGPGTLSRPDDAGWTGDSMDG